MRMIKRTSTNFYKIKQRLGNRVLVLRIVQGKYPGCTSKVKKTSFGDSEMETSESEDDDISAKRRFINISESGKHNESKVKLKKLCRRHLRQAHEKSLKLKQLKVLVAEHSSVFSSFSSKQESLSFLKKKLEHSDKFTVEGKRVRLSRK